jgi:hypothetical protein
MLRLVRATVLSSGARVLLRYQRPGSIGLYSTLPQPVTLVDETPVTTIEDAPEADGQAGSDRAFRPHVFT